MGGGGKKERKRVRGEEEREGEREGEREREGGRKRREGERETPKNSFYHQGQHIPSELTTCQNTKISIRTIGYERCAFSVCVCVCVCTGGGLYMCVCVRKRGKGKGKHPNIFRETLHKKGAFGGGRGGGDLGHPHKWNFF